MQELHSNTVCNGRLAVRSKSIKSIYAGHLLQ